MRLDDAVGGNGAPSTVPGLSGSITPLDPGLGGIVDDSKAQSEVKKSLLNTLRQKLVDEEGKVKEVTEELLRSDAGDGMDVDEAGVIHVKVD